jgi:long-chain fatty acid transport protein
MKQSIITAAVGAVLFGISAQSSAGGLAIGTQSGSGTGNTFAGGAASAEDASTVWYNPAGMTALPGKRSFAISAHALKPSFRFADRASTLPPGSGDGGDGGDWALVPQGYYATSLADRWWMGVAFNVPFGLATEYDAGWRGQPTGVLSELKIYNFNLGVAYKVSDVVSLGAGASLQRAELKFNSVPAVALGLAEVKLDDNGAGFNFGALFHPSKTTRIGLHYRSSINYQLAGTATAAAALGANSAATAAVRTPESFSISALTALSPKWDLMGDITWTAWSRLKRLDVVRTSGPAAGVTFTTLTFNWKDTWRYSVGANYKLSELIKVRFGVAYDEAPTNDVDRTPRVPDQDRIWVAIGGQYRISKAAVLDFGYAHEFFKDANINTPAPLGGRLIGQFNNKADIFSVQYSHAF